MLPICLIPDVWKRKHHFPVEVTAVSSSFNNQETVESYDDKVLLPIEEGIFGEYLSPAGRVLDLGCGNGRTARSLKYLGHTVVAVDFDADR